MSDAPRKPAPSPAHPLFALIVWALRSVVALILALVLVVAIQLVGHAWWWPEEGTAHTEAMLERELSYLSGDFRDSLISSTPAMLAKSAAQTLYHYLFEVTRLTEAMQWLRQRFVRAPDPNETPLSVKVREGFVTAGAYFATAALAVEVFAVRATTLALSTPTFLMFGAVGLADGLARRDLRRWGGGRESSFVYHHAKRFILPSFTLAWILYLCMPWSVNPSLIIVPCAMLFGAALLIAAATFKKYL
jgi:integrating conjugative element membrane protein (TIGR03747 family)